MCLNYQINVLNVPHVFQKPQSPAQYIQKEEFILTARSFQNFPWVPQGGNSWPQREKVLKSQHDLVNIILDDDFNAILITV